LEAGPKSVLAREMRVAQEQAQATVYFDGSCPLCCAEIGYYSSTDEAGALCFIDVSQAGAEVPEELTQRKAMQLRRVGKAPPSGGVCPPSGSVFCGEVVGTAP